jgi:hypothetical protein
LQKCLQAIQSQLDPKIYLFTKSPENSVSLKIFLETTMIRASLLILPLSLTACDDIIKNDPILGAGLTQRIELQINSGYETKFGHQALRTQAVDALIEGYESANEDVTLTFSATGLPEGTIKFFTDEKLQIEGNTAKIRKDDYSTKIYLYADALVGDSIQISASPSSKSFEVKGSVTMPITQAILRLVSGGYPDKISGGGYCSRLEVKTVTRDTLEWMWSDVPIQVNLAVKSEPTDVGSFFKDDQCLVPTTDTKILADSDSVSVYFKTQVEEGAVELQASAPGFPEAESLKLQITK